MLEERNTTPVYPFDCDMFPRRVAIVVRGAEGSAIDAGIIHTLHHMMARDTPTQIVHGVSKEEQNLALSIASARNNPSVLRGLAYGGIDKHTIVSDLVGLIIQSNYKRPGEKNFPNETMVRSQFIFVPDKGNEDVLVAATCRELRMMRIHRSSDRDLIAMVQALRHDNETRIVMVDRKEGIHTIVQ